MAVMWAVEMELMLAVLKDQLKVEQLGLSMAAKMVVEWDPQTAALTAVMMAVKMAYVKAVMMVDA